MSKLKGAIIGFGFISGKGHYPSYMQMDDVEIVAICDICKERRTAVQNQNKNIRIYENYQDLLTSEKGLDFVDISTPPAFHLEIAMAAAGRGINVLCEKPLTTTLEESKQMLETAQREKVVIFPCHNYKHAPVVKKMREISESGELGTIRGMTLNIFRTIHALGTPEWITDWRRMHKYSGGGIIMDHASHSLYLTYMFLGGFPTSVSCSTLNLSEKFPDTEDNATMHVQFGSKAYANIFLTWTAGMRKVVYTLLGTKGACKIEEDDIEITTSSTTSVNHLTTRRETLKSSFDDASHTAWFKSMFELFKKAIIEKDYVNAELRDAFMCINVIDKAYASARNNSQKIVITDTYLRNSEYSTGRRTPEFITPLNEPVRNT